MKKVFLRVVCVPDTETWTLAVMSPVRSLCQLKGFFNSSRSKNQQGCGPLKIGGVIWADNARKQNCSTLSLCLSSLSSKRPLSWKGKTNTAKKKLELKNKQTKRTALSPVSHFTSLETGGTGSLCPSTHNTDEWKRREAESTGGSAWQQAKDANASEWSETTNDRLLFPWLGQDSRTGLQIMIASS